MYKRRWRNILINKGYQLRFVAVLVGIAAILMAGLGWVGYREARETTILAENSLLGQDCKLKAHAALESKVEAVVPTEPKRKEIVVEESSTTILLDPGTSNWEEGLGEKIDGSDTVAADAALLDSLGDAIWARTTCEDMRQKAMEDLSSRYRLIVVLMVVVFVITLLFLTVFGLRLTHRVAGPLYRVGVHLEDLVKGEYRKPIPIRDGDLLEEFYEHFVAGYKGVEAKDTELNQQSRAMIEIARQSTLSAKGKEALERLERQVEKESNDE